MGKVVTKEISKQICDLYTDGISINECAKMFNLNRETIGSHLHKNNILVPNKKLDDTKNENYFEKIDTRYKAYFLGFIVSDGSISKKTNRLVFTINSKDDYILEEFKKDINSSNLIRRSKVLDKRTKKITDSTTFQVSSKKIKLDLENKGITAYKSLKFEFPKNIPDNLLKHFFRGMMDGDGYISKTKARFSLISTLEFLNKFNEILFSNSGKIYEINKEKNVYKLLIQNSGTCLDFLNYIYSDANIFLERKYDNYLKIIDFTNNLKRKSIIKEVIVKKDDKIINIFESLVECAKHIGISASRLCTIIKKKEKRNDLTFELGQTKIKEEKYISKSKFNLKF